MIEIMKIFYLIIYVINDGEMCKNFILRMISIDIYFEYRIY